MLVLLGGCAVGEVRVQPLDSAVAVDGQLVSRDISVNVDDSATGSVADTTPIGAADAAASGDAADAAAADGARPDGRDGAAAASDARSADSAATGDARPADGAAGDSGAADSSAAGDSGVDSSVDSSADAGALGDASVDSTIDTSHDSAPSGDASVDTSHDSSVDSGGSVVPGAPCPCSSALLCVLGACRQLCEPPSGVCNVVSTCPASQACVPTTTGVHVCVPAGNVGSPCSGSSFCPNGAVCGTFGGQALCRRTCSTPGAACVGGGSCVAVNGGCAFCL